MACKRTGQPLAVSGSDDGDIKLWDPRVGRAVQTLPESYQVTAVEFSQDGSQVSLPAGALVTAELGVRMRTCPARSRPCA